MTRRAEQGIKPITAVPIFASAGENGISHLEAANAKLSLLRGEGEPEPERGSAGWLAPIKERLIEGITGNEETAADKPTVTAEPTIRVSPSLSNAIIKAERTAEYRIWSLLRHLDTSGTGSINSKYARTQITKVLKVCGKRRYNQIIRAGLGVFWERWGNGRLRICGMAAVCRQFDVRHLSGKNVEIKLKDVTGTFKQFKAALLSSFYASRKSNPISRETIRAITGISERTQQELDQISGVTIEKNIGIATVQTPENIQDYFYDNGQAAFSFIDHKGKQGKKGVTYNAQRLPNTYYSPLTIGTNGRKKKVNTQLNELLVIKEAQGKSSTQYDRIFYHDQRQATNRAKAGHDAIWRHTSRRDYALWSTWENGIFAVA